MNTASRAFDPAALAARVARLSVAYTHSSSAALRATYAAELAEACRLLAQHAPAPPDAVAPPDWRLEAALWQTIATYRQATTGQPGVRNLPTTTPIARLS